MGARFYGFLGRAKVLANSNAAFSKNRRCRKASVLRAVAYSNMRSHGVTHDVPETQTSRFVYLPTEHVRAVRYHCCDMFNSKNDVSAKNAAGGAAPFFSVAWVLKIRHNLFSGAPMSDTGEHL